MSKFTTALKVTALILPLGLAGCATTSDLSKVAAKADAAQSTANEALAKGQFCAEHRDRRAEQG